MSYIMLFVSLPLSFNLRYVEVIWAAYFNRPFYYFSWIITSKKVNVTCEMLLLIADPPSLYAIRRNSAEMISNIRKLNVRKNRSLFKLLTILSYGFVVSSDIAKWTAGILRIQEVRSYRSWSYWSIHWNSLTAFPWRNRLNGILKSINWIMISPSLREAFGSDGAKTTNPLNRLVGAEMV